MILCVYTIIVYIFRGNVVEIKRGEPISKQIRKIIRLRIRDGLYPPGSKLPSEKELSDEFGVSRTTLRLAFAPLIENGLIWRRQGDGTYVNKKALEYSTHVSCFKSFFSYIEESGKNPALVDASFKIRSANEEEIDFFDLEGDELVFCLKQLMVADGEPGILSSYIIPVRFLIAQIDKINPNLPITDFLTEFCTKKIYHITSDICAALPPQEVVVTFNVEKAFPMLKLKDTFFCETNIPVVRSTNYLADSVIKLSLFHKW